MITKPQIKAAVNAIIAMAEAIRELKQVPSGTLYAHLMGVMSIEQYESLLGTLINAGLVRKDQSHMLTWIGGEPVTKEVSVQSFNLPSGKLAAATAGI